MELKNNVRALNFFKKLLLNDTKNMLPFPIRVQKPAPENVPCTPLPRCTPDEAGVPAAALEEFLRALAATPLLGVHHVYVLRRGKVLCESHFAPYEPQYFHVTHSLCKSFTGTAVGMLIDEGKLSLDECVCDILPDKCTLLTSKKMRSVTVRHLVTMRSGVNFREMGCVLEKDWAAAYLSSDLVFEPGERFDYNSMNSYMLSAIVTRKTGMTMFDYLKPRLFEPLGFGSVAWETCPMGCNKGGWGLYALPEDLAKLGQLYLNKGVWNGKRLLSEAWVNAATKPDSIHENGEEYGYQLWTHSADGSFMFNGMLGQYDVVCPALDMVILICAGSGNLFTLGPSWNAIRTLTAAVRRADEEGFVRSPRHDVTALRFVQDNLHFETPVPAFTESARENWVSRLLPAARKAAKHKAQQPAAPALPAEAAALNGKSFAAEANRISLLPFAAAAMCDYYTMGTQRIAFRVRAGVLWLLWTEGGGTQRLPIGFGKARKGEMNMGGNRFVAATSGVFVQDEDAHTVLKLTICLLESTSAQRIKLFFLPDRLLVKLEEQPSLPYMADVLDSSNPDYLKLKGGLFKDLEYFQFRLDKFCYPQITLTPEEPAAVPAAASAGEAGAAQPAAAPAQLSPDAAALTAAADYASVRAAFAPDEDSADADDSAAD